MDMQSQTEELNFLANHTHTHVTMFIQDFFTLKLSKLKTIFSSYHDAPIWTRSRSALRFLNKFCSFLLWSNAWPPRFLFVWFVLSLPLSKFSFCRLSVYHYYEIYKLSKILVKDAISPQLSRPEKRHLISPQIPPMFNDCLKHTHTHLLGKTMPHTLLMKSSLF